MSYDHGPQRIESPKLLLVEGKDEKNLFEELIKDVNLQESYEVHNYRGEDKLRAVLPTLANTEGFDDLEALIITQDADDRPADTFSSVQQAIEDVDVTDLPIPNDPFEIEPGKPSVCVFIFPDGEREGCLETLCIESVQSEQHDVFDCVEEYLSCIRDTPKGQPNSIEKARAHAYIASTESPNSSVGVAAKQGFWNLDHEVFEPIRDILMEI